MRPRSARYGDIGPGLKLLAVQWLDLDRAGDIPLPNAKTDGVQENAAIDDVHVSGEAVERHLRPWIFAPRYFKCTSAASSFGKLILAVGSNRGLELGLRYGLALLRRLTRRANPARLGAEEAAEIGEIDLAGRDIGGKAPPALCRAHRSTHGPAMSATLRSRHRDGDC